VIVKCETTAPWSQGGRAEPKSSPKKRIQTAEYGYAEKWNDFAYFAYSAVLSPFYFDDVFESSGFCAVLSGAAAVRRGFGADSSPRRPRWGVFRRPPAVARPGT